MDFDEVNHEFDDLPPGEECHVVYKSKAPYRASILAVFRIREHALKYIDFLKTKQSGAFFIQRSLLE